MENSSDTRKTFEIFRNRIGRWCVRRADGLVFGTFFEKEAAVHFARRECSDATLLWRINEPTYAPIPVLDKAS